MVRKKNRLAWVDGNERGSMVAMVRRRKKMKECNQTVFKLRCNDVGVVF